MYCSHCGAQSPEGASFCAYCGKGFGSETAPAYVPVVAAPLSPETALMRRRATTAMVLGIIACVVAWYPLFSIAAIVMGAIAISKANQVRAHFESLGQLPPGTSTAGKVTGIIGLIAGILMTILYLLYIGAIVLVLVGLSDAPHFPYEWEDIPIAF